MLTGCQKDRTTCQKTDRQTDRQTDGQTDRKIDKDKTTFQLSYQNKCCSECQCQNVNQTVWKIDRAPGRQTVTETQYDRISWQLKSPLLF